MTKKETVQVNLAAANPNLSPATRFGDLVFVAGQTGRHPITGGVGKDVREQTRYTIERIKMILETGGTSPRVTAGSVRCNSRTSGRLRRSYRLT
jgi:enamine deaminase RidA (YjgF/YER057c/UK114 family)